MPDFWERILLSAGFGAMESQQCLGAPGCCLVSACGDEDAPQTLAQRGGRARPPRSRGGTRYGRGCGQASPLGANPVVWGLGTSR